MPRRRFAIITYDPDHVEMLSWHVEGNDFGTIVWNALCGRYYDKGFRGIINITVMDQVPPAPMPEAIKANIEALNEARRS